MRRNVSCGAESKEIVSIIKSYKMYENFQVLIDEDFPKIVLQSNQIQSNKNGIAFYPSITIYESTYANDIYDEKIGIWYGRRLVKIHHELIVPCIPMLRIFLKYRYVTIINDYDDSFDLLCSQIISKVQTYEIMSINKPNCQLQWIEENKNIVVANGVPICRVHQCKVRKEKPKFSPQKSSEPDRSFYEKKEIYFPNCKHLFFDRGNAFFEPIEEIYVCKECDKEKIIWEKTLR